MAAIADTAASLDRISYSEGQVIDAAGLTGEQQYLVSMRRRHDIGPHTWGIVSGLDVEVSGGLVTVAAGFAVDGYGRELAVPAPVVVAADYLAQLNSDRIAISVVYGLRDRFTGNASRWNCTSGHEDRTVDETRIRLTTAGSGDIDPRNPPEVNRADRSFSADQSPPDDQNVLWPVLLGVVTRSSSIAPWEISLDYEARRPYAGLRGQRVTAPSGTARIRAGSETLDGDRAFAVDVADATGKLTERLAIDSEGDLFLNATTTISGKTGDHAVKGNLVIPRAPDTLTTAYTPGAAGCRPFENQRAKNYWGIQFGSKPAPQIAEPWQVYHARVAPPPPATPGQPALPLDELRFEFLDPGKTGNRKGNRLVIGKTVAGAGGKRRFVECLAVDAECTVWIYGVLRILGHISTGPAGPDPTDPRFQLAMLGGWKQGLLSNTKQLADYYGGSLTASIVAFDQVFAQVKFPASVTVANNGTKPILNIKVAETHNLPNVAVELPEAFNLQPGEQKTVDVNYTVPEPGAFSFTITLSGVVSEGYQASASASASAAVVKKARIKATLDVPPAAVTGHTITYGAGVRNAGDAPLSQVSVSTAITGGSQPGDSFLSGATLQTSEARAFTGQVSRGTPGAVHLTLNAAGGGEGPHNDAVSTVAKTVQVFLPASVSVSVQGLAPGTENQPMPFNVLIGNDGDDAITVGQITPSADLAGAFAPMPPPAAGIAPHTQQAVPGVFTPAAPGALTLTVTVEATGAGGDTVRPSDSAHNNVIQPVN